MKQKNRIIKKLMKDDICGELEYRVSGFREYAALVANI